MRRGRFIVFEGIDGSGKTTQCVRLAAWLRRRGRDPVETREPTQGHWGRRYRDWAGGALEVTPDEVLEMFVRDRREHVSQLIAPSLGAGRDVVCDRYAASTLAYQAAQGLERAHVEARLGLQGIPSPDLTLWLRLPVEHALSRIDAEGRERFEQREFLIRVDAEYERMGLTEIDASASPDAVHKCVVDHVAALLDATEE